MKNHMFLRTPVESLALAGHITFKSKGLYNPRSCNYFGDYVFAGVHLLQLVRIFFTKVTLRRNIRDFERPGNHNIIACLFLVVELS